MVSELTPFVSAIDCVIDKIKCGRHHTGTRQNGKKMRWMAGLLMAVSLGACGADKQSGDVSANGEVEVPAAPVDPTLPRPASYDPWASRDRNATFQTVKFGETLVRVPTGYIHIIRDSTAEQSGLVEGASIILEAPLPELRDRNEVLKEVALNGGVQAGYQRSRGSDYLQITIRAAQKKRAPKHSDSEIGYLQEMFPTREFKFVGFDTALDMSVYEYRLPSATQFSPYEKYFIPRGDRKPNAKYIVIGCDVFEGDPDRGLCSTGLSLGDAGISIRFPTKRLAMWKQIHKFVLNAVQIDSQQ
jgi:hypothetical protein